MAVDEFDVVVGEGGESTSSFSRVRWCLNVSSVRNLRKEDSEGLVQCAIVAV
jgi:hypothetical protein